MIGVEISPQNIAPTLKAIRQLEPDTIKTIRAEIKGKLGSVMSEIQSAVPNEPPLSGMRHNGRTAWKKPRVSLQFSPALKLREKEYHPLVSITISGAAFKIAELAGSRDKPGSWKKVTNTYTNRWGTQQSHAITSQGANLINVLKIRYPISMKAGRFAFQRYLKVEKNVAEIILGILNDFVTDFNKRWGI